MLGKLLNGIIERAADQWLTSDKAKRQAASAVLRAGQLLMGYLLLRWARRYGLSDTAQGLLRGHWEAMLTLAAPAIGAALIEAAAAARAALTAKTIEVAVASDAHALTPDTAKEVAKVALT